MFLFEHALSIAAPMLALLAQQATAHTWVEVMQLVGANGSYVGADGFSRGYMARTDPGFNGESNLWMLPALEARNPDQTVRTRINGSDLLCHPSQRASNYTDYPMLKASPGSYVAMKYLENGHVTLPWTVQGKPQAGGTVLVFGTTQPKSDEKIVDVMQWTKDGSGGDKRGSLIGQMDYDDGECHQINTCVVSAERQILAPNNIPDQGDTQAERWCESDIQIPKDTAAGTLTVYWVWDWGTAAGEDCLFPDGKDQYYTSCADIQIVVDSGNASTGNNLVVNSGTKSLEQQDPNSVAAKNYASRTAVNSWTLTTAANWADFDMNKMAAPATSGAANSSWRAFCATSILAQQASVAANPNALPPSCPPDKYAPTGASYSAWAAAIKASATDMPAEASAPTTAHAATSAPPTTTAPPATTAPAAAPSASAPAAPAPAQSSANAPAGSIVTVTETRIFMTTLTTHAVSPSTASPPAASAPTATPSPPADTPVNGSPDGQQDPSGLGGFPTISVIDNPSAGMAAAPDASGTTAPMPHGAGPGASPQRRHAREFGRVQ